MLAKRKLRMQKAVRFSTLEAICKTLGCQPGEILEYKSDEDTQ
ncbi:helix-turn-helix domain-containing protein [Peribacillus sp. NPDC094092]